MISFRIFWGLFYIFFHVYFFRIFFEVFAILFEFVWVFFKFLRCFFLNFSAVYSTDCFFGEIFLLLIAFLSGILMNFLNFSISAEFLQFLKLFFSFWIPLCEFYFSGLIIWAWCFSTLFCVQVFSLQILILPLLCVLVIFLQFQ